ncbi:MAG: 2OG-Fe(II) oxygenase [Rhodocyclaceae bacterium]|nr:2OG-Fe(II) oxygenase [Rhodocyclaceae bacterium]
MSAQAIVDVLRTLSTAPSGEAGREMEGDFAIEGRLPGDAIQVEIDGAGRLALPVSEGQAERLSAISRPARFGRRQETLLDASVRDCGEIAADDLKLRWRDGVLAALLSEVAQGLGAVSLEAEAHNLLIYGPGQFFKPHQDTEKRRGMVATLVVVLPSAHIGGTLRVSHGSRRKAFASQQLHGRTELRWFAFYADCRHEVRPVDDGWRLCLTFDLLVPRCDRTQQLPVHPALRGAMARHFGPQIGAGPDPWALLLDHEYSENGLRWSQLKGRDRQVVEILLAAASEQGLVVHLALAELRESWTAVPAARSRRGDAGAVEPGELIESTLDLDFWFDGNDQVVKGGALSLEPRDVDSLTETDERYLVESEYEGYMGNYGETLDYWYRRAALVVQSPLAAQRARLVVDFDAALADLVDLARRPDQAQDLAARIHAGMEPLRREAARQGRQLLADFAEIVAGLPDGADGLALMEKFAQEQLLDADSGVLARMEVVRGTPWLCELLDRWGDAGGARWGYVSASADGLWPKDLPEFFRAGQESGLSPQALDHWAGICLSALNGFDGALVRATPASRMSQRAAHLQAVCDLAGAMGRLPVKEKRLTQLLDHVLELPNLYPPRELAALAITVQPESAGIAAVDHLRGQVVAALGAAHASPRRGNDDWCMPDVEWPCRCADCRCVIAWAESSVGAPLVLAIAERRRSHVGEQLRATGVDFGISTVRQGSPHKLVVNKPRDLHAREKALRQRWQQELEHLRN